MATELMIVDGTYRLLRHESDGTPYLESLEGYPFEAAPSREAGRWVVGFRGPKGWTGVRSSFPSAEAAQAIADACTRSEGSARVRAEVRRWRDRKGVIQVRAEGPGGEVELSPEGRLAMWEALEATTPPPAPEPAARTLSPAQQRELDRAETLAMLDAERTPLHIPASGRRCPECGYQESLGHRMDCCFA